jgi:hypothetical protein
MPKVRDKQRELPGASSHFTHLALGIDLAVEIPLIVAFHPATLLFGNSFGMAFPSIIQITLQLLVLLVVERSFHSWTIWVLPSDAQAEASLETPEQFFEPFGIAIEFMRPRGTILIAMTGLGVPSVLTRVTGKFHVISVIAWVILRQIQTSQTGYGYDVSRKLGKEP